MKGLFCGVFLVMDVGGICFDKMDRSVKSRKVRKGKC